MCSKYGVNLDAGLGMCTEKIKFDSFLGANGASMPFDLWNLIYRNI